MSCNWNEIPDIIKFMNEKNIKIILNSVYFPPKESLRSLNSSDLLEIYNYYKNIKLLSDTKTQIFNFNNFESLKKQIYNWYHNSVKREKEEKNLANFSYEELKITIKEHFGENNSKLYLIIIELLDNALTNEQKKIIVIKRLLSFPKEILLSELQYNTLEKFKIKLLMFNY